MSFNKYNVFKYLDDKGYKYSNATYIPYHGPDDDMYAIDIYFNFNEQPFDKLKREDFSKIEKDSNGTFCRIHINDWERLNLKK